MRIEDHIRSKLPLGSSHLKPETFQLPKPGERDPHFGLSRTFYYELEKAGEIQFIRLKKRGCARGVFLDFTKLGIDPMVPSIF